MFSVQSSSKVDVDLALVDWTCEDCGYKWSNHCPFKDGVLTAVDDEGDSWEP